MMEFTFDIGFNTLYYLGIVLLRRTPLAYQSIDRRRGWWLCRRLSKLDRNNGSTAGLPSRWDMKQ
jgi:hypothetical protein